MKPAKIVFLILILSTSAFGQKSDYSGRFGLRVFSGTSGYAAFAAKDYGLAFPLGLEGTYLITNALEVNAGFRGVFSLPLSANIPYALPYSLSLGMRYYYNPNEPIKAYTSLSTSVALDRFGFEFQPSTFGLQWDIDDNFSVFGDGGLGLLLGSRPDRLDRWEVNLRFGFQLGLHYHF